YQAVAQGSIDLAAGDSTDGRILTLDLVVLEDDRHFFPPYQAVPLVREETLHRHPELAQTLNRLAGKIDAATMRRLNHEVDGKHPDPAGGAGEFRGQRGSAHAAKAPPAQASAASASGTGSLCAEW